ncbi:hypothetical protein GUJ93_ZPchr0001g30029 [Zizania palustris]|uniref:Uncharacterized protein n=1 Tax=Zizania palustris TaxID=103762 RepID=A0A8J5RL62_ZIZPA|nr:hypothetical protein GUJ93_ZPchr0001g30029 [Zizania palustris]
MLAADEVDEGEDPGFVAVGVAAAAGDDEPVERGRLGVQRELTAHGAVHPPPLAVLRQQRAKHLEVPPSRPPDSDCKRSRFGATTKVDFDNCNCTLAVARQMSYFCPVLLLLRLP